jgi:hypothetical protein
MAMRKEASVVAEVPVFQLLFVGPAGETRDRSHYINDFMFGFINVWE